jgi:hypothetical protein
MATGSDVLMREMKMATAMLPLRIKLYKKIKNA